MPNYFEFDQNKQQDYNAGGVNESGYQLSPELYQALYGKGGYGVNKLVAADTTIDTPQHRELRDNLDMCRLPEVITTELMALN